MAAGVEVKDFLPTDAIQSTVYRIWLDLVECVNLHEQALQNMQICERHRTCHTARHTGSWVDDSHLLQVKMKATEGKVLVIRQGF